MSCVVFSQETADSKSEEGMDDVKSAWPLCLGLHRCYNGRYNRLQCSNAEPILESRSKFGLRAATRPHEVGIASKRVSAMAR